jgi:hypothetical protein
MRHARLTCERSVPERGERLLVHIGPTVSIKVPDAGSVGFTMTLLT